MAKVKHPRRFTELFKLDPAVLAASGAFDPILNADTRLFVDPLLLSGSQQREMRDGHETWRKRFRDIVQLLHASRQTNDVAWRAAERLFNFPEFIGTCLGYGSSIHGTGMGVGLRRRLLHTAKAIVDLGVNRPELFALLPLIEDDIGPDRISDMTTRIIARHLEQYTQRVLSQTEVPLHKVAMQAEPYRLPINPLEVAARAAVPIVLVPRDVLRDLPTASDWDDVSRVAAQNAAYRNRVNAAIGEIWAVHSRRQKAEIRSVVLSSKEAANQLISTILGGPKTPYNIEEDEQGLVHWLELGRKAAHDNPLQLIVPAAKDRTALRAVVDAIVDHFISLVENNDVWQAFWHKGKRLPERHAQLLFFAISDAYCRANNVDITPEAGAGGGPVDFKFSSGYSGRVLVEVKMSDNPQLVHGYSVQLEIYKKGQRTSEGIYLVVDVGSGGKQLQAVLDLAANAKNNRQPHSSVAVADATPKLSASRR
jgi:hypothetical protein